MRQFQGSLAPLQDLEAERLRPAPKSNFSEQAPTPSKPHARRWSDHRNYDRAIGWGLMLVIGIGFWAAVFKVVL
jgi:hypothetical protein